MDCEALVLVVAIGSPVVANDMVESAALDIDQRLVVSLGFAGCLGCGNDTFEEAIVEDLRGGQKTRERNANCCVVSFSTRPALIVRL